MPRSVEIGQVVFEKKDENLKSLRRQRQQQRRDTTDKF